MSIVNNILIFIFAILPIIMYVSLMHFMIPGSFVSHSRARRYLISGLLSPFIIFLVYFIFPNWGQRINDAGIWGLVFFTVVQIGFLEEICKYTIFQWVTSERTSSKNDLPIAIMFHSMMTSLGFALTENISYIITYNDILTINPMSTEIKIADQLFSMTASRSITAVIVHMICGVILGYFISKSISSRKRFVKVSIGKMGRDLKLPNLKHFILGIFFASLYHGVYNANLMLPDNQYKTFFTCVILGFGLSIGYFIIDSLIKESKLIRQCKLN